jgi:hypothetical protein
LGERFFCVLKGSIAIIKNADAIPKFGFLFEIRTEQGWYRLRGLPLDLEDGTELADMQSTPVVNHPSSKSSVLLLLVNEQSIIC